VQKRLDRQKGPGASSRKTRIETLSAKDRYYSVRRPGASSRKTRIETRIYQRLPADRIFVRARVPEKQGLKLVPAPTREAAFRVRARVPEKQGLKHVHPVGYMDDLQQSGREFQKNKD